MLNTKMTFNVVIKECNGTGKLLKISFDMHAFFACT